MLRKDAGFALLERVRGKEAPARRHGSDNQAPTPPSSHSLAPRESGPEFSTAWQEFARFGRRGGLQNEVCEVSRLHAWESPSDQNLLIHLQLSAGIVPALYPGGGYQTKQARMKRIEAVVMRSALPDFHRCARRLGIFGFDLCEVHPKLRYHQRLATSIGSAPDAPSRFKIGFAVLDEETKPTIHAVLESVHPESIGIFKFDQDTRPGTPTRRNSPPNIGSLS